MNQYIISVSNFLHQIGLSADLVKPLTAIIIFTGTLIVLWLIYYLLKRIAEPIITRITRRTAVTWDDIIFRHKAIRWVWILIVVIIANYIVPVTLGGYELMAKICDEIIRIMMIITLMMLAIETLKSIFLLIADRENVDQIAKQMHQAADNGEEFVYVPSHSLKGLQQMLTILIVGASSILVISVLIGKDPLIIFSALGAMAAVLMLIFQDSILGVVAGIQITANDMLQPGDWIVVPKYNANGIVREVTLATVKIQNWDKSITTIQPYKLISEGFQNWRGMQDSHGRRITRQLYIDFTSIRKATELEAEQWRAEPWGASLPDYGDIVNLAAFRRFLEHYITTIPSFVPTMLYMVREMEPTPQGLPIEVYFFTSHTEWKQFEHVQADAIDNIIANVSRFGLRLYQSPSSHTFQKD